MTNPAIREVLDNNTFFSQLSDDYIDYLSEHAVARSIGEGEVVFRLGEHADKFYLVNSGAISVEIPALYGPTLVIQNLGPSQILGWSWLTSPYQWDFQAKVDEASEVLEFDGAALLKHCDQNPEFGYALLKRFTELMSERLHAARQRMMDEWNPSGFA